MSAPFLYPLCRKAGGFFVAQGAERIKMLADNYIPVRQLGNGNTTGFSFDFDMMSEAYVRVYRETDGVQELVPADEYTAELDGSAGGVIVLIRRRRPERISSLPAKCR